jgi:N-succinyldiaminopimelate aminotransferase
MNPNLSRLHAYPFARLNTLLQDIRTTGPETSLALGEPQHRASDFFVNELKNEKVVREGFGRYPATEGSEALRIAISEFITRRYSPAVSIPDQHVLPVNGTREALFSIAQAVTNPSYRSTVLIPNPFYQIYEGAALLAGMNVRYLNEVPENNFCVEASAISEDVLTNTGLIYLCNPGNPHGRVMTRNQLKDWILIAQEYQIPVVSDECYSEIFRDEESPPPGLLQVAAELGITDFNHCLTFNSLSKRSNLPGLRSGFVAGDANLIDSFRLYRTYHGSAMALHTQRVSTLAWQDEAHVRDNRALYREKFDLFISALADCWPIEQPDASFFLYPTIPPVDGLPHADDQAFTQWLYERTGVKILPGSFLSRETEGINPGAGHVRIALVSDIDTIRDAAEKIRAALVASG